MNNNYKYKISLLLGGKAVRQTLHFLIILILASTFDGCKKFITVETPNTNLSVNNAFSTDGTAIAAVTSIYSNMSNNGGPFATVPQLPSTSGLTGLYSDELVLYSGSTSGTDQLFYYQNALVST